MDRSRAISELPIGHCGATRLGVSSHLSRRTTTARTGECGGVPISVDMAKCYRIVAQWTKRAYPAACCGTNDDQSKLCSCGLDEGALSSCKIASAIAFLKCVTRNVAQSVIK